MFDVDFKLPRFAALTILLGCLLLLVGLSGGLKLGNYGVYVPNVLLRWVAAIISGCLIVGAFALEFTKIRAQRASVTGQSIDRSPPSSREDYLTSIDSREEIFPALIKDAVRVQIYARTMINLANLYGQVISERAGSGCQFDLILVDPESKAAASIYGSKSRLFQQNSRSSLGWIARLQRKVGSKIRVRLSGIAPTMSLVVVEKPIIGESFLQVQFYFHHGPIGRNRPVLRLPRGDPWYDVFSQEFSSTWKKLGDDSDISNYAEC